MIKMANTIANTTQENGIFYDKVLLKRLVGNLHFVKYGQKRNIAKHNGTEIDMRRFNSLAPATTPLTEGVTPNGSDFTVTNVRATVKQYGDYVTVSDVLDMAGLDPVITEMAEVLGEQAAETIDNVIKQRSRNFRKRFGHFCLFGIVISCVFGVLINDMMSNNNWHLSLLL